MDFVPVRSNLFICRVFPHFALAFSAYPKSSVRA
jgi:hypothetical protein